MIVLKDRFVSNITPKEISEFKSASSRSKTKQEKVFLDKSTEDVTSAGIELAKKNKRKIAREKTREL